MKRSWTAMASHDGIFARGLAMIMGTPSKFPRGVPPFSTLSPSINQRGVARGHPDGTGGGRICARQLCSGNGQTIATQCRTDANNHVRGHCNSYGLARGQAGKPIRQHPEAAFWAREQWNLQSAGFIIKLRKSLPRFVEVCSRLVEEWQPARSFL